MPYLDENEINEYIALARKLDGRFPMLFAYIKDGIDITPKNIGQKLSFGSIIKNLVKMNPAEAKKLSLSDVATLKNLSNELLWYFDGWHDYTLNYEYVNSMRSAIDIIELLNPCDSSPGFVKKTTEELKREYEKKKKINAHIHDYSEDELITKEQSIKYKICCDVYSALSETIDQKRNDTIDILLDQNKSTDEKKGALKTYVEMRMCPTGCVAFLKNGDGYSEEDLIGIAQSIYHDNTFLYNDNFQVLNSLSFREDSITFLDEIIAFHNYRLSRNERALHYLIKMLTVFMTDALELEHGSFDTGLSDKCCSEAEDVECIKKLVMRISNYWDKYSKFFEQDSKHELSDDRHEKFSDRIDEDAGREIGNDDKQEDLEAYLGLWNELLSSAVTESEVTEFQEKVTEIQNQIESGRTEFNSYYASDRLSNCTKTIYLLLSTVKEINLPELTDEKKRLRNINNDICKVLFSNEDDPYAEMEEDKRLNREQLMLEECNEDNRRIIAGKNRIIQALEYTIKAQIQELDGEEPYKILERRNEILSQLRASGSSQDVIELIEQYSIKISRALEKSIVPSNLEPYRNSIKKELGSKYKLLSVNAIDTLASAEYLYSVFVIGKHPGHFDFSGIAALYFQAFEATYNKLLVVRYTKWLKQNGLEAIFADYARMSYKGFNSLNEKEKEQYNEDAKIIRKFYQTSQISNIMPYDKNYKKYVFANAIEMGKLVYWFNWFEKYYDSQENVECSKFKEYLACSDGFGIIVDKQKYVDFARKLQYSTSCRNEASHGACSIDRVGVEKDKKLVYDDSNIQDIRRYKNILYEFLSLINENNVTDLKLS